LFFGLNFVYNQKLSVAFYHPELELDAIISFAFLDNPGNYGADFQSERLGAHSVVITLDGVPVSGSPIEVLVGKPALSPINGSPPATSTRSVKRNPKKPGELWDVHGIAIGKDGQIVVTDSKCHRIQVIMGNKREKSNH
jgi:hypothetical protein